MIEKHVGSIIIQADDTCCDAITFIFPAHRGQVIVSAPINCAHIESAIKGMIDEDDVYVWLDCHRPWDSTQYIHWVV